MTTSVLGDVMSYDQILLMIQKIIYERVSLNINYDELLYENGIDSVEMIDLLMDIEEKFDIEFDPSALNYRILKSIRTIGEYVYNLVGGGGQ